MANMLRDSSASRYFSPVASPRSPNSKKRDTDLGTAEPLVNMRSQPNEKCYTKIIDHTLNLGRVQVAPISCRQLVALCRPVCEAPNMLPVFAPRAASGLFVNQNLTEKP